ncbi:MAG: T9SS type A sorting domain-containing protein [Bacteroidetes bacterium]|nr:T9SS type A sorting domain-containing protein [Bacteroidota bacterium]
MSQLHQNQLEQQERARKINFIFPVILLFLFIFLFAKTVKSQPIYVNQAATGLNDGSSWANAYPSLQTAIEIATPGRQIWVAQGTYKPSAYPIGTTDGSSTRDYSFTLRNNVQIFGGFVATSGTEGNFGLRNFAANPTILSGDIGVVGDTSDNCYHIVLGDYINGTAILDGFTIRDGNANANLITTHTPSGHILPSHSGAGMFLNFASPNINNCVITNNQATFAGGGVVAQGRSDEVFTNCVFTNNRILTSTFGGAGLYNYAHPSNPSFPTVNNCVFYNNNSLGAGGAIYTQYSNMTITNTTIYNNTALLWGGGIYNEDSSNMVIRNCIIWGNTGNAITHPAGSDAGLTWNVIEPNVRFSLLQTYSAYSSNITGDPLFINRSNPVGADGRWISADDGLRLSACSPAIDAGTNSGLVMALDISALIRPQGAGVDMGAYESTSTPTFTRLYVDASATSGGSGSSWATAMNNLETALTTARTSGCTREIWVKQGNYHPSQQYSVKTGNDTTGDDRRKTFNIPSGVAVYGGFIGTETVLTERSSSLINSVLSGDIGVPFDNSDNCYHVVMFKNVSASTILDGFTITNGNANSSVLSYSFYHDRFGGGICQVVDGDLATNEPSITNCKFSTNYGFNGCAMASLVSNGGNNLPVINKCLFTDNGNAATEYGGAIYSNIAISGISNPMVTGCVFQNNIALYGAGVFMQTAGRNITHPIFSETVFANNNAQYGGGFMTISNDRSILNAEFVNCVFAKNNCFESGAGAYFEARDSSVVNPYSRNCTFYKNKNRYGLSGLFTVRIPTSENNVLYFNCIIDSTSITNRVSGSTVSANQYFKNCNVQGCGASGASWNVTNFGTDGGGNIDTNPLFVNVADLDGVDNVWATADDGLQLQNASPCVNTGDNAISITAIDIVGTARPIASVIDMGAYEKIITSYTITASASTGGSITPAGITTATSGSSLTYTITANTGYCINDVIIDGTSVGAVGTYTFSGVAASHTITVSFVTRVTPAVSITSSISSICFGSPLTITATSTNGGSAPMYNFYIDGVAQGAMAANIFNTSSLSVGLHSIYCIMTANNSCQTTNTTRSNTINVVVGNATTLSAITGNTTLCSIGATTRLSNTITGGVWSSSNPSVATINSSTGIVTAVANGLTNITYSYTNSFGCISSTSINLVVAAVTGITPITGAASVCIGSSITLANTTTGGVWSSIAGRATVNASGVVTGTSAGVATIRYTVSNAFGCSTDVGKNVTVNAIPPLPFIAYTSGTVSPQCGADLRLGRTFGLRGTPSGGAWSSSNSAVININPSTGITSTVAIGTATISYTVRGSNGCSSSRDITKNVVMCLSRGISQTNEINSSNFIVYPNPAKNIINIKSNSIHTDGKIIITDLIGKTVLQQTLSIDNNRIDVSSLAKGMYLINIVTSNTNQTQKIIVE